MDDISRFFMRGNKEDWKIIALCFLGATIFWFFNALNKQYTASIRYPVDFVFDRDSTVLVNTLPDEIRLIVSGGGWDLLRKTFWFDIEPVTIDLENPTETEYLSRDFLTPLVREQVTQIEINEVLNDTIPIHIEKKISKTIPIKVDTARLRLAEGLKIVSEITLDPDSVTVTGPESQIKAMSDIFLISLYNSKIENDYDNELNLEGFLPSLVNAQPNQINVQFEVKEYVIERVAVKVETINFPSKTKWYLRDSSIVVSIELPEDKVKDLNSNEFTILADYRRLNKRDSTIEPIIVSHPEYVSKISLDTSVVRLNFRNN